MNNKFSNPLDDIKVASPCSQDWNAMIGSERKRYCGECKLNVYNLSGMSRDEAENLIRYSEGRLCVRFFRRADGTILTQDCPVGWRAVKVRATKMATAFASLIFGLLGGLGLNSYMKSSDNIEVGAMKPMGVNSNINKKSADVVMGDVEVTPANYATMGNFTIPPPKDENEARWEVGKKTAPTSKKNRN